MTAGPAHDPLHRALAALAPPPAPPPFERVAAAYDARRMVDGVRRRVAIAAAAAAAVVVAAGLLAAVRADRDVGATAVPVASLTPAHDTDATVVRDGRAIETPAALVAGDRVEASAPVRLRLGARATVELGAGARLTLLGPTQVEQHAGLALYDVVHDERAPLRVRVRGVEVVDAGTRFTVDAGATDGPARALLTVEEGAVEANGVRVASGHGLAFLDGKPAGPAWPLDAKPVLALEVEEATPTVGRPVTLRVVLENPTDGWVALPTAYAPRSPLWIEVTRPDGTRSPLRVTDEALVDGARTGGAIPPRGKVAVRVRFSHVFDGPGTYRCRAVYRPADAVDPPASADVLVVVR